MHRKLQLRDSLSAAISASAYRTPSSQLIHTTCVLTLYALCTLVHLHAVTLLLCYHRITAYTETLTGTSA
jgi:hypothetical protein